MAVSELIAGRYEVVKDLGKSSTTETYLAKHKRLGDLDVVIKVFSKEISSNPNKFPNIQSAIVDALHISHPNVVEVYEFVSEGGVTLYSMEYIDGLNLVSYLESSTDRKFELDIKLIAGIFEGLNAIHTAGSLHTNLKLQNILIDASGVPKVSDLGFSEQGSEAADIYEASKIGYRILTGVFPSELNLRPVSEFRQEANKEVDAVFAKALSKDAAERFLSAREMTNALSILLD